MAITSIKRDTNNNVSLVRFITTDSLTTVATANYIKNQQNNINALNDGTWQWFTSDMILCNASDGNALFTFTDDTFSSLQKYGSGGGGVTAAQVQQSSFNFVVDSGVADAYVGALTPATSSLTNGLLVYMITANSNVTTTPTFDLDGHGAKTIVSPFNSIITPDDINAGSPVILQYSSTFDAWVLQTPSSDLTASINVTGGYYTAATDTGSANNYAASLPFYPNSAASTIVNSGTEVNLLVANNNTGDSTFSYGGLTATQIVSGNGTALASGVMQAGFYSKLIRLNDNKWQLMNPFA